MIARVLEAVRNVAGAGSGATARYSSYKNWDPEQVGV